MPLGTTHPLDADGALSQLYYYLAKEHFRGGQRAHLESARVYIPPTVLFEQGFAKAWFSNLKTSDVTELDGLPNVQVKRKLGKEVSNSEIYETFTKGIKHDEDIAATLVSPKKKDFGDPGQGATLIQYFTKKGLKEFLFASGQKPEGTLQKFVMPKGTNNCTIQATWSQRVTITEGRRNATSLYQYTKSPFERAATVEDPSYGNAIVVTPVVISAVRNVCRHIVHHLYLVEHIRVVGMILLFKVDSRSNIKFLYSLSMRVQTDSGMADFHANNAIPLNLSVRLQNYETYEREEAERQNEEAALRSTVYQVGHLTPKLPPLKNEPPQVKSNSQRPKQKHVLREKPLSLHDSRLYKTVRVCPTYSSIAPLENLNTDKSLRRRVWRGLLLDSSLHTTERAVVPDLHCAKLPKSQSKLEAATNTESTRLTNWLDKQRVALRALCAVQKCRKKPATDALQSTSSFNKVMLAPLPNITQSTTNKMPLRNDDDPDRDLEISNENVNEMSESNIHADGMNDSEQFQTIHLLATHLVSSACDYVEELLYAVYSFFLSNAEKKDFYMTSPPSDIGIVLDNEVLIDLFHRCNMQSETSASTDSNELTRPRLVIPYIAHDVNSRTKTHDSIRNKLFNLGRPPDGLLYKRCCQLYLDEAVGQNGDYETNTSIYKELSASVTL